MGRDAQIWEARKAGETVEEIGERFHLRRDKVEQICTLGRAKDEARSEDRAAILAAAEVLDKSIEKNGCVGFVCSDCANGVTTPKDCPVVEALHGLQSILRSSSAQKDGG